MSARVVAKPPSTFEIRVRGRVQGVGFRPAVWRIANELKLDGEVLNDGDGVIIRASGEQDAIATLIKRIRLECPPLGDVQSVEPHVLDRALSGGFHIAPSVGREGRTEVAPDVRTCPACISEIDDPSARRYRYPFNTCTHCGPRLTIVEGLPFDRELTTMAPFIMCSECRAEYNNPNDRRFHAQALGCLKCGPKARLIRLDGKTSRFDRGKVLDDVDAAASLIKKGEIIAIKGLGGYQLACDATNEKTVARLRELKKRDAKPFALMARDIAVIREYCILTPEDKQALSSAAAPIVIMPANGSKRLPPVIAPGLGALGFMLPTTPLHILILQTFGHPVVMTSGNLSDEPQVICDNDIATRLGGIATYALVHDREIANRVDDSVVRVSGGKARVIRRARGYAPAAIRLPNGFGSSPHVLAMGGELKTTFCNLKDGAAVLSQHQGDLEDALTFDEYKKSLALYTELFGHTPVALVIDKHPEYLSTKLGHERAKRDGIRLIEVQHHHAHVAACLAENGRELNAPAVLGIVLDGLGWGDDETIWGGEFLLADYRRYKRLGTLKPVAMLGGAQASRQPWRNLYTHLMAEMRWAGFTLNFGELEVHNFLSGQPRATLDAMLKNGINVPIASSCGRLFDAVAAALGICRYQQAYEGEAAARLEAIVDDTALREENDSLAYPFTIPTLNGSNLPYIEPLAMWNALLSDLAVKTSPGVIAARFHVGLAKAIANMTQRLALRSGNNARRFDTVALSGGCFQNRVLFEEVVRLLKIDGFTILSHVRVPANDGGLALGQAAVAAAQLIDKKKR
ncbi:MAG: carbamoyltransferase HypF [Hyphomicrobium sp.]|nr:MAG: carbamoyltransferase HypF [Hyphomicrobium sp.]PPC98293.1 MAG: carbamoyltransferase HypF [Hyphomicrobium sp.]